MNLFKKLFDKKNKQKSEIIYGNRYDGCVYTYVYDTPEVDAIIAEFEAENSGYRVAGYTYADCVFKYAIISSSPITCEIVENFESKFNPERIIINLRSLREQCYRETTI